MATYLTAAVQDQLAQAQVEIQEHLRLTVTGHCAACGEAAPCQRRNELSGVFAKYGTLPQRRPGAAGAHFRRRVA